MANPQTVYVVNQGNIPVNTLPAATAPGTPNPQAALPMQGVTNGVPVPVNGTIITSQPVTVGDGVIFGGASAAVVISGGTSGFIINDLMTLSDGGIINCVLQVTGISGGGQVTAVSIYNVGKINTIPSNPVSMSSTTGSGVGTPTFNMTWIPIVQVLFNGQPPVNGWKVFNPTSTGNIYISDVITNPSVGSSYIAYPGKGFATESWEKPGGSTLKILGHNIGQPFIARMS